MQPHELNLDSIAFAELRVRLNEEIESIVKMMNQKGLREGQISAKIKITMMQAVDENGEIHTTAVFEPKVSSKIGNHYEGKCGATGGRITVTDDGTVIMGQIGIDELMDDKKGA